MGEAHTDLYGFSADADFGFGSHTDLYGFIRIDTDLYGFFDKVVVRFL